MDAVSQPAETRTRSMDLRALVMATGVGAALQMAAWFALPHGAVTQMVTIATATAAVCAVARACAGRGRTVEARARLEARADGLEARARDMRWMLDHVEQALVTVDRAACVSAERSRAFDTWFDAPAAGTRLFDLFAQCDASFGSSSDCAWEQVVDALLPLELTLSQMPAVFTSQGRELRVAYQPIGPGETPERFLVVVTDVTALEQRRRAEGEKRETLQVFERLLQDRAAFLDFYHDAASLIARIARDDDDDEAGDVVALQHALHTLKGNAAVFGLDSVAWLCHELEDVVVAGARLPEPHEVAPLMARWQRLTELLDQLGTSQMRRIEIDEAQHTVLEQAVRLRLPSEVVLRLVHELRLEPARHRLDQFANLAHRVARQLGKPEPIVTIEHHGLKLDPRVWAPFWASFVHCVRNAVDHGLEPGPTRRSQGKLERGALRLRTVVERGMLVIEIADDGRGVDWDRVAQRARDLGLPAESREELERALFADGLSTAHDVSDVSGRGVGMGAVRVAVLAMGGRIEVDTTPGRGTVMRMLFPADAAAPGLASVTRSTARFESPTGTV